jgi:hypothetical protein
MFNCFEGEQQGARGHEERDNVSGDCGIFFCEMAWLTFLAATINNYKKSLAIRF